MSIGSGTTSFNITKDISAENQLWSPLDFITIDQELGLGKPNTRLSESFDLVRIVNTTNNILMILTTFSIFLCFAGSRNRVVVDIFLIKVLL